jgi:prepilin-type N-terminal cleavage/methylation domain-containing protein
MRGQRRRDAGFTLIEIMTVMAVLAILMSIVLVGYTKLRQQAYVSGTKGLLDAIAAALEQYKSDFGQYPPDGFDPKNPAMRIMQGSNVPQKVQGSAALLFYLTTPLLKQTEVGEEVVMKRVGPYLDLKETNVSGSGDLNQRLADPRNEILDAWGNPIHYARIDVDPTTQKPRLLDQSSSGVHTMPGLNSQLQHGPDPRVGPAGLASQKVGAYDLWSHGADVTDPTDDIANWK